MRITHSCFLLAVAVFSPMCGKAVMFYSTSNTTYNTTAPTGVLTNSGWQLQGTFLQFLGTPIAPHHFITAKHFGGSVGHTFSYEGTVYTTITKTVDAGSDLAIWEIDGTFPQYARLYDTPDEVGNDLVVFGRGTRRGAPVVANGDVKGWKWGAVDLVQRWGENHVAGLADFVPGSGDEKLLYAEFNSGGGTNECMLSNYDSGGGLFIQDEGVWELAAINYAVGPRFFSYSATGSPQFDAAMFDFSFWNNESEKVYYYNGSWQLFTAQGEQPCFFYSTRISSRYDWITNNVTDFDQDVDGLPDWWETLYEGNATSMVASADTDLDGFTHYEEWLADTIPDDSNSFLRVTDYSTATNLAFNSSTNRKYQIRYRLNLADTNENWQTEVDWFTGSNSQTVKSVSSASSNRFYHVRAKIR